MINTLSNEQKTMLKNAAYGIGDSFYELEGLQTVLMNSGNKGAASKVAKLIAEMQKVMNNEVLAEAYQKL